MNEGVRRYRALLFISIDRGQTCVKRHGDQSCWLCWSLRYRCLQKKPPPGRRDRLEDVGSRSKVENKKAGGTNPARYLRLPINTPRVQHTLYV